MIYEADAYGMPILPDAMEMDDEIREARRQKTLAVDEILEKNRAKTDLTANQRLEMEFEILTSREDTDLLIRAGLLGKILRHEEEDMVPEFGPAYDEGFLAGVHWSSVQGQTGVLLSIKGFQKIDGELNYFDGLVYPGGYMIDFSPEELEFLATLADSKQYS